MMSNFKEIDMFHNYLRELYAELVGEAPIPGKYLVAITGSNGHHVLALVTAKNSQTAVVEAWAEYCKTYRQVPELHASVAGMCVNPSCSRFGQICAEFIAVVPRFKSNVN
jgi:hypothetical protein